MDFLLRQQPMFTTEEMEQIANLTVLIAGVGGLGTHQALQLQRIGVEKIYLVDPDKIEATNLNRQILYGRDDLGRIKAIRAKEVLDGFGLGTEVVAIPDRIDEEFEIPVDVDLVCDALDNFASRYILEERARVSGLPLIHGGVHSWYGQITTIIPGMTSSLRDLLGGKEEGKEIIPAFSPVVSILASLQVIETIKVALNRDDILANRLLMVDLIDYSLTEIEI